MNPHIQALICQDHAARLRQACAALAKDCTRHQVATPWPPICSEAEALRGIESGDYCAARLYVNVVHLHEFARSTLMALTGAGETATDQQIARWLVQGRVRKVNSRGLTEQWYCWLEAPCTTKS